MCVLSKFVFRFFEDETFTNCVKNFEKERMSFEERRNKRERKSGREVTKVASL